MIFGTRTALSWVTLGMGLALLVAALAGVACILGPALALSEDYGRDW